MGTARDEYTRRLNARREAAAHADSMHLRYGFLRLLALGALATVAIASLSRGAISAWWLLAPIAALWGAGQFLESAERERARRQRAAAFYERALARLDDRWAGTGETGERFAPEDHLYALDLDLFGDASVYQLLCAARTPLGEETLASWLLAGAAPEVVRDRQQAVRELVPDLDLREDLAVLGEKARSGVHGEALLEWGERAPLLTPGRFRRLYWLLSAVGVSALAAFLITLAPGELPERTLSGMRLFFIVTLLAYGMVLWRFRARTERAINEAERGARDLNLISEVLARFERTTFQSPRLVALRRELDSAGEAPSARLAKLDRLMEWVDSRHAPLMGIIGPLLLLDLHLGFALEAWRTASGPALRRWLSAVGEMEALSSIAGFAHERPHYVFPEFSSGPALFDAAAIAHPLLPSNDAVANDVRLGGGLQVLVVSGSNMSGKSTLLRTVGVNAVLAQAGAPVRASRLTLSPLAVGASIRVHDSLQSGESRFYAEILRLRRIVEQAESATPVLFLIDEFLHGTNSHDRRIGAEAIVRGLVDRAAIGLVTTHDLALADIGDSLAPRGANVHFEDHLEDGRIRFDYRMQPGVVRKSNALELMRSVGLKV